MNYHVDFAPEVRALLASPVLRMPKLKPRWRYRWKTRSWHSDLMTCKVILGVAIVFASYRPGKHE